MGSEKDRFFEEPEVIMGRESLVSDCLAMAGLIRMELAVCAVLTTGQ